MCFVLFILLLVGWFVFLFCLAFVWGLVSRVLISCSVSSLLCWFVGLADGKTDQKETKLLL